ncbi:MAG: hypothetical protein NZ524_06925, partial [Thiobacillaceae bacterium]|nr:hypothetical protein [Thiobacillaceae bacterium]
FVFEHVPTVRTTYRLEFDAEPSLEQIERQHLLQLYQKYGGHRARLAAILGVSERNIYRLLAKHGLK